MKTKHGFVGGTLPLASLLFGLALASAGTPTHAQGFGLGGYPNPYASPAPGTGCGCVPGGTMGPGAFGPESDLNQAQQQELNDIRNDLYQSQLRNQRELSRAMADWQTEMTKPMPDPEAAASAYDDVTAIQSEMLKQRLEAQNKVQRILSEDGTRRQRRGLGPLKK
jgi:protein CpxP